MPTPEAEAHIEAQTRLQAIAAAGVAARWDGLPNYDEESVAPFLAVVVPLILAAQRRSAALTTAFLARAVGRSPIGFDVEEVIGAAIRTATPEVIKSAGLDPATKGVPPEVTYRRPFVQTWTALSNHTPWVDAVAAGRERAMGTAAMDVQNTMRHTLRLVGERDDLILGYRRVPDGNACAFCKLIAGRRYRTSDLMEVHPRCVAGDTMVWSSSAGAGATRRRYEGQIVLLKTAAGHDLAVTPNHPILTDRGWVGAGLLREGDSVISSLRPDGVIGRVPDEQHMPSRIEDRFRSQRMGRLVSVPFSTEQFHGDAGDGDVNVVFANGRLDSWVLSALADPVGEASLGGGPGLRVPLSCLCAEHLSVLRLRYTTRGGIRGKGACSALLGSRGSSSDTALLRSGPLDDSGLPEMTVYDAALNTIATRNRKDRFVREVRRNGIGDLYAAMARERAARSHQPTAAQGRTQRREADADNGRGLFEGLAGQICLDSLVEARRVDWGGDVFNLVTSQGWYTANAIVTHNCGCGVDVITAETRGDFTGKRENDLRVTRNGVTAAVVQHGELGSLLVDGNHSFSGHDALAA